jgi:hypothetical protein
MISLKISLGIFFLRIVINQVQRRIIYFIVFLSSIFGFVYFFFIIFQCGAPIHGFTFWEKYLSHKCVPDGAVLGMAYTHAIINALTDTTFAIMPYFMVWKAKLTIQQKFLIGAILTIAALYVNFGSQVQHLESY